MDLEKYEILNKTFNFEIAMYTAIALVALVLLWDIIVVIRILIRKLTKKKSAKLDEIDINNKQTNTTLIDKFKKFKIFQNKIVLKILRPVKTALIFVWKWKLLATHLLLILVLFLGYKIIFDRNPKFVKLFPNRDEIWTDYNKQIEITFDRPVNVNRLKIYTNPEVDGKWVYEKSWDKLPFARKVHFEANESFPPDQKIMVYLSGYVNYFETKKEEEHLIEFFTPPLPDIVKTSPDNESKDVAIDKVIELELDADMGPYAEFEFTIDPLIEFYVNYDDRRKIKITPSLPLKQDTTYTITGIRKAVTYEPKTLKVLGYAEATPAVNLIFSTVKAPLISSIEPAGTSVLPTDNIMIVFDHEMIKEGIEDYIKIEPALDVEFIWENETTLILKPSTPLPIDTQFSITLLKGIKNNKGGMIMENYTHTFSTVGELKIIGSTPAFGAQNTEINIDITIEFDQPVNQQSVINHMSISPGINNQLRWEENKLIIDTQTDLQYSTNYRITFSPGIESVYGKPSTQTYQLSFTTKSNRFVLNVPIYSQQHGFTCNLAATRMTLAYRGIYLSEDAIYNAVPKDNTPFDSVNNIWGNPHAGYVGERDGNPKGYGIYWEPISAFISNYRSNDVHTDYSTTDITREVQNGNPVIVWWQNQWSTPTNISWTTPDGQYIQAVNGMHSEVVVGFIGPADNPTHLIVNDTFRGQRTLTRSYFEYYWGRYIPKVALVVR